MFKKPSVFKRDGIHKLDFEYVPSSLPHREEYMEKLVKFFRVAIDQPGVLSERILITVKVGQVRPPRRRRLEMLWRESLEIVASI